jgi:hypothetical protein
MVWSPQRRDVNTPHLSIQPDQGTAKVVKFAAAIQGSGENLLILPN